MSRRQLLLSIHDVMPGTLDDVEKIFGDLEKLELLPATLLVVPDTGWSTDSLQRLRGLVDAGAELAGHGWHHVARHIRGLRHRLHSQLISRDVAEHLALSRPEILSLVQHCYDWFGENGLAGPQLYVPPAWAMGDVKRSELKTLPFDCYETLQGVYDVRSDRFRRTAMVGYEADTAFRGAACRCWNWLNLISAGESRPIRVAIHPRDLELRLADDLRKLMLEGGSALSYRNI
jgi:predicted deacetylase